MTYQVKLKQFEGPLPLLLELIEKEQLDITTLSLSEVADDFLAYIDNNNINLQNLSEFLLVASHLILIKSKALLPFFEFTQEEKEDINDLEKRLQEYARFKKVAQWLGQQWLQQNISFSRVKTMVVVEKKMPEIKAVDLYNLVNFVLKIKKEQSSPVEEIWEDVISLEEKIIDLKKDIKKRLKINFNETIKHSNKLEIVVSFLAVLEMLKQKFIIVKQKHSFGNILIERANIK